MTQVEDQLTSLIDTNNLSIINTTSENYKKLQQQETEAKLEQYNKKYAYKNHIGSVLTDNEHKQSMKRFGSLKTDLRIKPLLLTNKLSLSIESELLEKDEQLRNLKKLNLENRKCQLILSQERLEQNRLNILNGVKFSKYLTKKPMYIKIEETFNKSLEKEEIQKDRKALSERHDYYKKIEKNDLDLWERSFVGQREDSISRIREKRNLEQKQTLKNWKA